MATAALKRRQLLLFSSRGVAANRFQFRLGNEESQRGDPIQEDDKGISALTVYAYPSQKKTTGNVKLLTIPPSSVHVRRRRNSAWHFRRLVFKTLMVTQTLTASNATLKECFKRDVRVFIARPPRRPSSGAAVAPSSSRPVRASPRVYPRVPTRASPTREPPRSIRPGPPLDRAVGARL